jgi:hypothetical protein
LNGYGGRNWDYGGHDLLYCAIQTSDRSEETHEKRLVKSNIGHIEYKANQPYHILKIKKLQIKFKNTKNCPYTDYNLRNLVSLSEENKKTEGVCETVTENIWIYMILQ